MNACSFKVRRSAFVMSRTGLSAPGSSQPPHAAPQVTGGVRLHLLGHSDLAMLEKHYAMVMGSAAHEAAEKIQTAYDRLTGNVVPLKTAS